MGSKWMAMGELVWGGGLLLEIYHGLAIWYFWHVGIGTWGVGLEWVVLG